MTDIVIQLENPFGPDAKRLMEELSECLYTITGDDGHSHFDPCDVTVCGAAFAVARDECGGAVGCGAIRPVGCGTAELKRMYAKRGSGSMILAFWRRRPRDSGITA